MEEGVGDCEWGVVEWEVSEDQWVLWSVDGSKQVAAKLELWVEGRRCCREIVWCQRRKERRWKGNGTYVVIYSDDTQWNVGQ
jgi:hypothetical protein